MEPNERDPGFGRFAFTVITIALVVIVLGLTGMYYFFQTGGANGTGAWKGLFQKSDHRLPPNQVMLYYTKDGKQLVGSVAAINQGTIDQSDKAKFIVENLLAGRDAAGLRSTIPAGTTVKSVFVNNNMAWVNLSKEMVTNLKGGVDSELLAVYSIVNSILFNMDGVDAVQILIEGEKLPTLGGHVDITVPLIANTAITRTN